MLHQFEANLCRRAVVPLLREQDLSRALERDQLRVVYQPIVALESGRVDGFEALVRWEHPEHGMLDMGPFIPLAEETGLVVPMGTFVLNESLAQLAFLHRRFPGLSMSVNLSRRQVLDERLIPTVEEALARSGVAKHLLKLEITESVAMEHAHAVAPVLARLRESGVSLTMDDFGIGQSSLGCLHRFPVNCLKIDRAFIHRVGLNRQYAAIVHAVVTMAHNFGMTVVAEGIDHPEQVAGLQSLDCDLGQGDYFSEPVLSNALPSMLPAGAWMTKSA